MYQPTYHDFAGCYFCSPDHYEDVFAKFEEEYGSYQCWTDSVVEEFIEEITGDTPQTVQFDKKLIVIRYTL